MGLGKKQMRLLFLLLLCVFVYTSWVIYNSQSKLSNDDFIRFHVIANSDSTEDQELKLKVRDGVLAKINNELVEETMASHDQQDGSTASLDLESSRQYIKDNISVIEDTAEQIIQENGYDYTVKAELGVKWIPQKTYGEVIFPSGNYEALNITIGKGKGHNWWCVLFPPLCLIDTGSSGDDASADSQEIYKEILRDKKYDQLTEEREKPTVLKLKFKTLELLEKEDKNNNTNKKTH